jgi:hypothetical protein
MRRKTLFSENVISYFLYRNYIPSTSRVFFKVSHNITIERNWSYSCAPDVDVIEVKEDNTIIAYEIKGIRKGKKGEMLSENSSSEWPAFYEGIGQALAYLNLPYVNEDTTDSRVFDKYKGGAFDFVYLVHPRDRVENFPMYEKRVFDLLPIGVILAIPNGSFGMVKEAPPNPLQKKEAKEHFLKNLNTLEKFSVNRKIFRRVEEEGKRYLDFLDKKRTNYHP